MAVLAFVCCAVGCGEADGFAGEGEVLGETGGDGDRDAMVVPEPERVSTREVSLDLIRLGRGKRDGVRELNRHVKLFDDARTSTVLQWLTAHAWWVADRLRGRASDAFMRRLARAHGTAEVVPGFTSSFPASAECLIDFDDPDILDSLPDQAQSTFALSPFYYEPCGSSGFLRVEPLRYNHYHLVYEDPTITCFDDEGRMGRGEFGDCEALDDPAAEPRSLGTHHGSEVIRIWRMFGGLIPFRMPFSMSSFTNLGGEPVKFRFRTSGGQWFQWNSLAGYTTWLVGAYVQDVVEVLITHADTSLACGPDWITSEPGGCPAGGPPFFLDDFAIDPVP